jgi:monovalent cation/hydrogen antiporter
MQTHFLLIFVLTTIAVAAIAASRLKLPPAIVMVLVGLVLAVTPGLPQVEIAPELVLLLVLPPLVYLAGVTMSWRVPLRSISLLAVGGVTFRNVSRESDHSGLMLAARIILPPWRHGSAQQVHHEA